MILSIGSLTSTAVEAAVGQDIKAGIAAVNPLEQAGCYRWGEYGYRWYDFGEVAEGNEGLAGFKAKWDTETRMLIRYHAPPLPHAAPGREPPGLPGP